MDEVPKENIVLVNLVVPYSLPESGNRASFQNIMFLLKIRCWPKSIKRGVFQLTLAVLYSLPETGNRAGF
jgi:hypothetical protein